jgi:acetyl esterase
VAWAADHAAELGAAPDRLALVGHGPGAALAERVAELAVDEGWPPLRHVALVWPHDDPEDALARLAHALAEAPSGRAR